MLGFPGVWGTGVWSYWLPSAIPGPVELYNFRHFPCVPEWEYNLGSFGSRSQQPNCILTKTLCKVSFCLVVWHALLSLIRPLGGHALKGSVRSWQARLVGAIGGSAFPRCKKPHSPCLRRGLAQQTERPPLPSLREPLGLSWTPPLCPLSCRHAPTYLLLGLCPPQEQRWQQSWGGCLPSSHRLFNNVVSPWWRSWVTHDPWTKPHLDRILLSRLGQGLSWFPHSEQQSLNFYSLVRFPWSRASAEGSFLLFKLRTIWSQRKDSFSHEWPHIVTWECILRHGLYKHRLKSMWL